MQFWRNSRVVKRFGRVLMQPLEERVLFAAPFVTSTVFNYQTGHSFAVTFSANVGASIASTDLVLYNLTDRTTVPTSKIALSYNSTTNVATFTFPGFAGGILPDANYQATIYATQVTDGSGTPMPSDSIAGFFVYTADANHDRIVDTIDFNSLAANFGQSGRTFSQGNFNYSGSVDTIDFNLLTASFGRTSAAAGAVPKAIDVATFNATPDGSADHFGQTQFDRLNVVWTGGRFLAMGGDSHRGEIVAKGNSLAVYYNNLTVNIGGSNGFGRADDIQNTWITPNFTSTGQQPTWIVLNEISSSLWPGDASYRQWVKDVVFKLHVVYGHEVVIYAPFDHPGANAADWQYVAKYAYIAAENYLDGAAINASGNSVAWCQSQYQLTKTSYANLGVPASRLILGEDFAQTVSGTGWGRSGVSYAGWDNALIARGHAAQNLAFPGFISYGWGKNGMLVPEADMVHFEDTYLSVPLP